MEDGVGATERWVTFYDGPGRTLRIVSAKAGGARWVPLRVDAGRSKAGAYTTWTSADSSEVLALDVTLGSNGYPVDPPEFLALGALGSPTVWPQEQNQYLWWLDQSPIAADGDDPFRNPWPEWSPDEPHGPASPIESPPSSGS